MRLARPLAELRGPERLRDVVRQRLSRLAPRDGRDARARGRRRAAVRAAASSPRRPGSTGRARRRASTRRSGTGCSRSCPSRRPPAASRTSSSAAPSTTGSRASDRAELHLRVGEALERVHAADPARVLPELAHHFTLAAPVGGAERAVDYNLRAGRRGDRGGGLRRGGREALDRARARDRRPARARARPGRARRTSSARRGGSRRPSAMLAASLDAATGLEERGVAARALVHRARDPLTGDPELDPEQMRDGRGERDRDVRAARRRARPRARRAAARPRARAPGPHGRGCAALETRARRMRTPPATRARAGTVIGDARRTRSGTGRRRSATRSAAARSCCARAADDRVLEAVDRPLPRRAARDGRPLRRGARARRAQQPRPRRAEPADRISGCTEALAAEAKELAGDRAGAEQELEAQWREFRDLGRRRARRDARCSRAYQLALLYCDDGRWDDAERVPRLRPRRARAGATSSSRRVLGLAGRARLAAHRGELAEALTLARARRRAARTAATCSNLRARAWLALAEVQRAAGATAEADAAVARRSGSTRRRGTSPPPRAAGCVDA